MILQIGNTTDQSWDEHEREEQQHLCDTLRNSLRYGSPRQMQMVEDTLVDVAGRKA